MTTFSSSLHPRAAAGKFTTTVGGVPLPANLARIYQKYGAAQTLGFNGSTGTGYGAKGGDARVKYLQKELNRLGFRDANGQPLKVDGKLGPLTTQAIEAAQRAAGMKPDGQVTPAVMARILSLPVQPAPKPKARPAPSAKPPVRRRPAVKSLRTSARPTARELMARGPH